MQAVEVFSKSKNKDQKWWSIVGEENGAYKVIDNVPLTVGGHFSRRIFKRDEKRIHLYEAVTVYRWKLHLFCATFVRYTTTPAEIEPGGGWVLDDRAETWTEQILSPYGAQKLYYLTQHGYEKTTFEQVQRDVVAVQKWAMLQPWPDGFIKLGRKLETP